MSSNRAAMSNKAGWAKKLNPLSFLQRIYMTQYIMAIPSSITLELRLQLS